MKIAVVANEDDVANVAKEVAPSTLDDDAAWCKLVAQPTIELEKHSLRYLSSGWGMGVGYSAFVCLVGVTANFLSLVHMIRTGTDGDTFARGLMLIVSFVVPFLLAADCAGVSTRCDALLRTINNLRLEWSSTEVAQQVHARVYPLQCTMKELNNGQGAELLLLVRLRRPSTCCFPGPNVCLLVLS